MYKMAGDQDRCLGSNVEMRRARAIVVMVVVLVLVMMAFVRSNDTSRMRIYWYASIVY